MLSARHRLRSEKNFRSVYAHGRTLVTPSLVLRFRPAEESGDRAHAGRYGFVVSKKIHKTIVARNRLKRQLRAAVRALLPRLRPGNDCIVTARKASIELSYQDIERELETLFTRARLLPMK